MKKAFTLLELIIVIIVVGILAVLGLTQYGNMMERGRANEAKMVLGAIAKNVASYRLQNGTIEGMTNADVNVGTQVPSSCASTHYFWYTVGNITDPILNISGVRCTTGGKTPNAADWYQVYLHLNLTTGQSDMHDCSGKDACKNKWGGECGC